MAYITGSVADSLGTLPFSLSAGTQLTMSIQNNGNAPSYFGLETIPNNNGLYVSGSTPKNLSGSFITDSGISNIVYDDYKMVAVVNPGGGTLTYTPAINISASTLWTKGTAASLQPGDFPYALTNGFSSRVTRDGGTVEDPDAIINAINSQPLLQNASYLMVPSGYKAGTLYSELSTSDYSDLTWGRDSSGSRINSLGNIENMGLNVPRLDYSYGTDPSVLLEPQRTNLDPVSQTFGGAWILSNSGGVTTSSVSTPNPFNFPTVQKLIPSTTLGQHRAFYQTNYSASGKIWAIVKNDGYDFLSFGESGGVTGGGIIFNLSNGTISGTAAGYTGEILPLGNGWYKCSLNMSNTGSISRWIVVRNNNTTADYSGDGTSGILIAHKQMEVGAYDTTAILTTGATTTRLIDTGSLNNIYNNGLINSNGGTWYVELENNIQYIRDNATFPLFISNTTSSGGTSTSLEFRNVTGGSLARLSLLARTGSSGNTLFTTTTNNLKAAFKWNGSNVTAFVTGSNVGSVAFNATNMNFLRAFGTDVPLYIKTMALFSDPLSDADCITLTQL